MVVDRARIERLERELEEARRELLKEDGERYRILMRDIATEEKERILEALTNKEERILFGLEAPEERRRGAVIRPGGAGGDLTCSYCGKTGLTKRGLGLHVVRLHKNRKLRKRRGKRRETRSAVNGSPAFAEVLPDLAVCHFRLTRLHPLPKGGSNGAVALTAVG